MDDLRARDKARLTHMFTIWLDRLLMYFPNPAANPAVGNGFDAITRAKDILVIEHARVRRIMTKLTVVLDRLLVNHALTLTRLELHTMSRQWALLNVMGSVYAFMFRSTAGSGKNKTTRCPHHHVASPAHERRAYVVLETIVLDHAHFKSRLKRSLEVV
jgi:hypothetical protein